ncbi:hypothetical protein SAMN05877838_3509 [Hoeflea halophila]|uniref:Uncharacterized protein n=1 Tax=Hoeflea halophila TaxID=714899 RepID=A0A286IEP0_9HYPH|nr:hypothetical protein SAMN05877838_3509 [Hoeflea halophila]
MLELLLARLGLRKIPKWPDTSAMSKSQKSQIRKPQASMGDRCEDRSLLVGNG